MQSAKRMKQFHATAHFLFPLKMILAAGRVAGNRLREDYKNFFYIAVKKWQKGKS